MAIRRGNGSRLLDPKSLLIDAYPRSENPDYEVAAYAKSVRI